MSWQSEMLRKIEDIKIDIPRENFVQWLQQWIDRIKSLINPFDPDSIFPGRISFYYHHHQCTDSTNLHDSLSLSLSRHTLLSNIFLVGLLDGTQCPHKANVCKPLIVGQHRWVHVQSKMEFLPSGDCLSTAVLMHHLDANKMHGEKG